MYLVGDVKWCAQLILHTILRLLLETGPSFCIAWSFEPRKGLGWQPSPTD